MIRCLAVDDELYAVKIMADYIAKVPFLELAGTTTSAIEALGKVQHGGIDLVFLDIQMPELTGLQFLKLCGSKCKVILTTAYPQYALDGYEHDVADYLLKPIAFDRFLKAVQKVQRHMKSARAPDHLFVKGESKNKFLKVDYDSIRYIEGLNNYVSVFTSGQRIVTYMSLSDLAGVLPQPPFYRVHRSYIISTSHMRMLDGNTIYIGDQPIPIGETYRDGFLKMIREGMA
jgi:DNA-binding LytR/AlgR family response regulator